MAWVKISLVMARADDSAEKPLCPTFHKRVIEKRVNRKGRNECQEKSGKFRVNEKKVDGEPVNEITHPQVLGSVDILKIKIL